MTLTFNDTTVEQAFYDWLTGQENFDGFDNFESINQDLGTLVFIDKLRPITIEISNVTGRSGITLTGAD